MTHTINTPTINPHITVTGVSDYDTVVATARWAGICDDRLWAVTTCQAPRLVISGRLASGKDTVAEAAMHLLGCSDAVRVSFATAIRKEVDTLLDMTRGRELHHVEHVVCDTVGYSNQATAHVAALITEVITNDPHAHSYQRTAPMRTLLQLWGTDIRRAYDSSYWTKQGVRQIAEHLADGRGVYVTDARFVNEVELAQRLGCVAVRLDVDHQVRAERLFRRDGLALDPAAENHPSERELEAFNRFDLRVDNSGSFDITVDAVVNALRRHF